jgi:hypothetical protein
MRTVRLVGMGQPRSRLAQEGEVLTGALSAYRFKDSLVECLD